jgi:uncharacterized membrane protein
MPDRSYEVMEMVDNGGSGYVGYLIGAVILLLTLRFYDARIGFMPLWGVSAIVVITMLTRKYTVVITPRLGISVGGAVIPLIGSLFMLQPQIAIIGPALITILAGIGLFYVVFRPNTAGSLVISPLSGAVVLFFLAFIMAVLTQKHSLPLNLIPITTIGIFGGDSLRASRSKTPMVVGYFGINDAIWIVFGLLSLMYFIITLDIL